MKPGYSIIEITVGIFLASLLAISLFQSVRSTTKTVALADDLMDLDMRIANFHHQFWRDTVGIFVPEKSEAPKSSPTQDESPVPAKPGAKTNSAKEENPAADSAPAKLPDRLFFTAQNEQGRLTEFTFITTNPVRVYEKASNVTVKPRMVRVMYRLLEDPKHANSFTLFRQESEELDASAVGPKAAKPIRAYALLNNIKKLSFDFSYPVKRDKEESSKPDKPLIPSESQSDLYRGRAEEPEAEKIVTRSDWPFKTVEDAQEKKVPAFPQIITAKIELWDAGRVSERAFTIQYPIASFTLQEKKKKKPKVPARQASALGKAPADGKGGKQGESVTKRIDVSLILKPKTEERLAELGQKVFKFSLEGKPKVPNSSTKEEQEFLERLQQLAKLEKSAS